MLILEKNTKHLKTYCITIFVLWYGIKDDSMMNQGIEIDTRFVSKIGSYGTVTIPKEVREIYNLMPGDLIQVSIVRLHKNGDQPTSGEAVMAGEERNSLSGKVVHPNKKAGSDN